MSTSNAHNFWIAKQASRFSNIAAEYQNGNPFPHTIFDDFLDADVALAAAAAFPTAADKIWIHYSHYNSDKHGLTKIDLIPEPLRSVLLALNSTEFISHLEAMTGIRGLIADSSLEGGGLHQSQPLGFLNVHADFTAHPIQRTWRRRVNLLIYFNVDWHDEYNGHLELWSKDMKNCESRISPILNRCVIFNTDVDSFHGVPDLLNCPEGRSRNSLALYYYTAEKSVRLRPTDYRARPSDGKRRTLIWLDKKAIGVYTRIKRRINIPDEVVGNLINRLRRKRR